MGSALICPAVAASLLFASLVQPCSAGKIKTFVNPNANFSSYKTYRWLPTKLLASSGIIEEDPTLTPIIKAAVNRELNARGLTEVTEGGDLEVATCALHSYTPQLEAVIFPGGVALDFQTPIATMGRYNREGTLAINLIDSHMNKSVWAGLVTESISNKPGSGAKKIPSATQKLFTKYPVKKQSSRP